MLNPPSSAPSADPLEPQAQEALPAVRATGVQRPLFLVHESHGADDHFALLAAKLGGGAPVRGLPVASPGEQRLRTVEGMAARLVEIVRHTQPAGPYRLAGLSFGGIVAYEMAIQLAGRDEAVEFLGLIDTACPTGPTHAQASYMVQRISIPVDLFVTTENAGSASAGADALLGWGSVLPREQVRVSNVPGNPRSLMTSDIDSFAGGLLRALSRATATKLATPEARYHPEVTIQTGRTGGAPLFCVPGAGDSVVGFAALAAALGDSYSLHGLQPRGTDGELVPHATVHSAAMTYVRAVDRVHPRSPVHLLGHSFGGWIVFEMALQLRAQGRDIASLTIVDSEAPNGVDGFLGGEHDAADALVRFIDVLELAAGKSLGIDPMALARLDAMVLRRRLHAAMVRVGLLPARSNPDVLTGPIRTFGTALRTSYRPSKIYEGSVRLVMVPDARTDAAHNQHQQIESLTGWRAWAPLTSLWIGPGNHMTVLKDLNARVLAQWWRNGLAAVSDIG